VHAALTPGGQVANPTVLDSLYTYAWFVTFGLSFFLYLLQARLSMNRFPNTSRGPLRPAFRRP